MAADGLSSRNQVPKAALGEWKERITIQKSILGTDKAGNHVLFWTNYYTCSAYVNNLSGKEYWAVSYTHLARDGWKRKQRRNGSGWQSSWSSLVSVSYTHLDVYKRQGLWKTDEFF